MEKNECPNCGATMGKNEKCCKYCGTANPQYVKPTFSSSSVSSQVSSVTSQFNPKKVNWLVAIILLIIMWPIGLVYIIAASSSKN